MKKEKDMLRFKHKTFDSEIVPDEIPSVDVAERKLFFRYKSGTSRSMGEKLPLSNLCPLRICLICFQHFQKRQFCQNIGVHAEFCPPFCFLKSS